MGDRLRPLWDFGDLEETETRLTAQLDVEASDGGRAEVLAEIARVHGLRGDFAGGDALLDDAVALGRGSDVAQARIELERGRLRRSSGAPEEARPRFETAYEAALRAGAPFIAADAAHMVALVAPDRDGVVRWTLLGVELAEAHEDASYWLGPLLNNLGWEYYEAGEFEPALDAFERALSARQREPGNAAPIEIARYAVGKTLRALGRSDDAIPLLEQAVAWAERESRPDGWFHEELAEEYAAVGRDDDAREQARHALPLLERDDPSFAGDAGRAERLRELARL
jgi:tetratricopeptide (TPR) repeat protein